MVNSLCLFYNAGFENEPDIANVAAEVKDILEAMRRGPGDSFEIDQLREQLAEAQKLVDKQARAQADLEKSLKVKQVD